MMIKMKGAAAVIAAGLLILALSRPGHCLQEGRGSGRLTGILVDEAGKPIEGANLTLEYQEFTNRLTAVSNSRGQWGFIGLGRGVISVKAEKEGYVQSEIQLEVSGVKKNPDQKIVMRKLRDNGATLGVSDTAKNMLLEGNKLFEEKKYAEALAHYQGFIEENPALYRIRINLANCYMELQNYGQAIAEYQKVLEGLNAEAADRKDDKLKAQIYSGMGDAFLRQNQFAEAEQYFKKSIDIDPTDFALAYNIAEIMMQVNNTDEAIRYYELAIRINPAWPKSYLKLGYAWLNKGDNSKAVEAFNRLIAVGPADDPDVALAKDIVKKISKIE